MNSTESALRNLYSNFQFRQRPHSKYPLSNIDKLRWLGGMETLLQSLGKLPSGIPFDYQVKKKKILWIEFKLNEGYENYILRNCMEFLKGSPS
jgi:hypothetical protein